MVRLKRGNVERIVSKEKAKKLYSEGFKPVLTKEEKAEPNVKRQPEDLTEKTLDELKTIAKKLGLTGVSALNKQDLLDILSKELGGGDNDGAGEN